MPNENTNPSALTDARIADDVLQALKEVGVGPCDIEIEVKDGVVTLFGAVTRPERRRELESVVRSVESVARVQNKLHLLLKADDLGSSPR